MAKRKGARWGKDEEDWMVAAIRHGMTKGDVAKVLGRTRWAIVSRLDKLGYLQFVDVEAI